MLGQCAALRSFFFTLVLLTRFSNLDLYIYIYISIYCHFYLPFSIPFRILRARTNTHTHTRAHTHTQTQTRAPARACIQYVYIVIRIHVQHINIYTCTSYYIYDFIIPAREWETLRCHWPFGKRRGWSQLLAVLTFFWFLFETLVYFFSRSFIVRKLNAIYVCAEVTDRGEMDRCHYNEKLSVRSSF